MRRLQSEIEFGRAQLHVVFPYIFGIAIEWSNRQEAIGARPRTHRGRWIWKRSIRERKNILRILEALIRQGKVCAAVELVAQGKIRRQTAGQIWTDWRTRQAGHVHRAIADKECRVRIARFPISGLLKFVSRLGGGPNVVLGDQAVWRVMGSAAVAGGGTRIALAVVIPILRVVHLVVQRLGFVVPHLHQTVDTTLRFVREVGRSWRTPS